MRKREPKLVPVLFYIGELPGTPGEIEYVIEARADAREVNFENFAVVSIDGRDVGVATYETLVRDYALAHGLSQPDATLAVERQAHEDVLLQYADAARADAESLYETRMDVRYF